MVFEDYSMLIDVFELCVLYKNNSDMGMEEVDN
jgi:hypothetical protein